MAKKRIVRRRKATRPKAAARRRAAAPRRKASDTEETMNIIAGILVVILIGLGIYFYSTSTPQKAGAIEPPVKVAMVAGR
jgi:hypothetical protein